MSIVSRFEAVALRTPDRVAVVDETMSLTYGELLDSSQLLAHWLRERGALSRAPVAILAERSCRTIQLMLAALRHGAPYLAIDPDAPIERSRRMLADSGASLIAAPASQRAQLERLAADQWPIAVLDGATLSRAKERVRETAAADTSTDAYILFTSGSTGAPKGVAIHDRSVCALVDALEGLAYKDLVGPQQVALLANFVFDPSVQQIFAALLLGHTLHIVPSGVRADGAGLARFLDAENITVCDGVPTHMRLIVADRTFKPDRDRSRTFIIGGEVMPVDLARDFLEKFGADRTTLINIYGVTECCVDSCAEIVKPNRDDGGGVVPIGRPLACAELAIVDDALQLVPDGTEGEIVISGIGVADGYLGRGRETEERFIKQPFGSDRASFRTGDIGKRLADGRYVFVGRRDRQVKIRGQRVELGEIEAVARSVLAADRRVVAGTAGVDYCSNCLLDSRVPGVTITDGICNQCKTFDAHRQAIGEYFGSEAEFQAIMAQARAERRGSDYDAMLLFSGGKDSTYVLLKLIRAGYKVLAYTFDNGFISDQAFKNIEQITKAFGVEHVLGSTPNMKAVFRESLRVDSTVCTGCFRGLSHLSTQLAIERGINVVITGLSRGQIFDTKLKALFANGIYGRAEIDRRLKVHRQLYEKRRDMISGLIGHRQDSETLGALYFVDYFRYDRASAAEVRTYLASADSHWTAPKDTGFCSTNCRANDVGIDVHLRERGYHNYAEPLSWDVRFGLISRADGLREIEVHPNRDDVVGALAEIGYDRKRDAQIDIDDLVAMASPAPGGGTKIALYCEQPGVTDKALVAGSIRRRLAERIPNYMVPQTIEILDQLPRLASGKIDYQTLRAPQTEPHRNEAIAQADDPVCQMIAEVWRECIDDQSFGLDDDFFQIGGDSFGATLVTVAISERTNKDFEVVELFERPTVRAMAQIVSHRAPEYASMESGDETIALFQPLLDSNVAIYQPMLDRAGFKGMMYGPGMLPKPAASADKSNIASKSPHQRLVTEPQIFVGWSFAAAIAVQTRLSMPEDTSVPPRLLLLDPPPLKAQYWIGAAERLRDAMGIAEQPLPALASLREFATLEPEEFVDRASTFDEPISLAFKALKGRSSGMLKRHLIEVLDAVATLCSMPAMALDRLQGEALFSSAAMAEVFAGAGPIGPLLSSQIVVGVDHWTLVKSAAAAEALVRLAQEVRQNFASSM